MATANRLPTPGGDDGQWGQLLNDFLGVEHGADGTLKIRTDGTLSGLYKVPSGGIPESDLAFSLQTTLGTIGDAKKIQGTTVDASAPSDGQVLVYSAGSSTWVPSTASTTVVSDATASTKGIVQLAGNLGGTASSPTVVATSLSSALPVNQGGTGTGSITGIVKGNGTGAFTAAAASDFPTLNQDTTGNAATATSATNATSATTASSATAANGLKTATTTVVVNSAAAPSSGQVLTATSSTAATWQTPAGGGSGGNGPGYTYPSVKTANYTASSGEFVMVDASSAGSVIQITLPAPTANGFVTIKKVEATTNAIEAVAPAGSSIDGGPSSVVTINNPWQSQDYLSDGTKWYQV